ncbi:hypothetical protein HZA41_00480 [Candidatus Peregrinibacteria bacterium]|nr:hypothetical protein [Candidatus Peregrinibacteria bacterium]
MGMESGNYEPLRTRPLAHYRGMVERWMQSVVLATTLLSGGCGNGAKTPEETCFERIQIEGFVDDSIQGSLHDAEVAEYCQEMLATAGNRFMSGCLTAATGKKQQCEIIWSMDDNGAIKNKKAFQCEQIPKNGSQQ